LDQPADRDGLAPAETWRRVRRGGIDDTAGRLPAWCRCSSPGGTVMIGPTLQEKRRIFERNFLLGKLSSSEIDALLTYSRVEHYAAGQEIFAKDSPGNSMMLVLRGSVRISSISLTGKEIVLNIINAGEIVGEIALLDGGERSGDAVAISDCELLVLNRRDFMPFLEKRTDICLMLIRILCQRLRQTSEQVEDLLFRHLEARVAKALLQLAKHSGRPDVPGSALALHLSQSELGNIVGSTRESVNKQLQVWHRAGLIELAKGSIVIRDAAAIEQLI
jgi:CRP/FNR family cyclic AMP-dependent transcriptional regulator